MVDSTDATDGAFQKAAASAVLVDMVVAAQQVTGAKKIEGLEGGLVLWEVPGLGSLNTSSLIDHALNLVAASFK